MALSQRNDRVTESSEQRASSYYSLYEYSIAYDEDERTIIAPVYRVNHSAVEYANNNPQLAACALERYLQYFHKYIGCSEEKISSPLQCDKIKCRKRTNFHIIDQIQTIIGLLTLLLVLRTHDISAEVSQHSTISSNDSFTFAHNGSFLQLDADKEWPFNSKREISFRFKTKSPHGLLFYQTFDHNKLIREDDQDNLDNLIPTSSAEEIIGSQPVISVKPSMEDQTSTSHKINDRPGELDTKSRTPRMRKSTQEYKSIARVIRGEPKVLVSDNILNDLPSKAITAAASERLVNSLFSSSPAVTMNGNSAPSSRISLPKNGRDTNLLVATTGGLSSIDSGPSKKTHRMISSISRASETSRGLISFGARTSPNNDDSLTVFSSSAMSTLSGSLYELYLRLENGRLRVTYEFRSQVNHSSFFGKGLNDERWHKVEFKVDPELNQVLVVLDHSITLEFFLPIQHQHEDEAIKRNELVFTNSVLYVGGLDSNASIFKNVRQRLYTAQFIGCIDQILIKNDQNTESTLQPATIDKIVLVRRGCINKCETDNYCLHESTCLNFYTHTKCDCFGTKHEDIYCWQDKLTTLSMLGYSSLIYRIYDWRDRYHSNSNRLNMQFRTYALDSILFFAHGDSNQIHKNLMLNLQPQTMAQLQMQVNVSQYSLPTAHSVNRPQSHQFGSSNYLAVALINGTIFVELSFGDGQSILLSNLLYDKVYNRTAKLDKSSPTSNFYRPLSLADGRWHNITFIHNYKQLYLHVDNYYVNYTLTGKNNHLFFEPSIYIGAVPNLLLNETRLLSKPFNLRHRFVGCLKSIQFNYHDILLSLKKNLTNVEYRNSLGKPHLDSCLVQEPSSLPLTIRSGKSYLTFQLTLNSQFAVHSSVNHNSADLTLSNSTYDTGATISLKRLTQIQFEYKTSLRSYFLAGGHLRDLGYHDLGGFWTLHAKNNCTLYFTISSGLTFEPEQVIEIDQDSEQCDPKSWFRVSISMISGDKVLNVTRSKVSTVNKFEDEYISVHDFGAEDDKYKSYNLRSSVEMLHQVQIGGDLAKFGESLSVPFSGCIRRIKINGHLFDSRDLITNSPASPVSTLQRNTTTSFVGSTQSDFIFSRIAQGHVTLDSCQLVTPCQTYNPCKNHGVCKMNDLGEPECDCSKTGYTGKRCHFSIYKQSCQELYFSGQRKSSHYLIDLDRNGPLKPVRVRCNMDLEANRHIETIMSHNLPAEYLIRHSSSKDTQIDIAYMAFHHMYTSDGFYNHDDEDESVKQNQDSMLRSLIGQSLYCKQHLKFECKSAPLELGNRTWMEAPYPKNHRLTSLDGVNHGKCMCATTEKKCLDSTKNCNCDSGESFWTDDSYELIGHEDVAITRLVILRENHEKHQYTTNVESQSRLTLSDLKCYGTKQQESQHEITFKTSDAFIEVPGWKNGDISFSFRTASNPPAIILFQLASSRNHGYFRLILVSDSKLIFEFVVNRRPRKLLLSTSHKLNNGEWQQVFIEYDAYNLRLTVNDDSVMIDLDTIDYIGTFEGPMYVGGAPGKYLVGDLSKLNGFTGCFKGLTIDGSSIDLRAHLSPSMPTVTSGCKPSCTKNLCQNGGKCIEYWGSYECECSNPIAHSGTNCEINLNTNSITFVTPESYYVQLANDSHLYPSFLIKNMLLNIRTYQETALILYASDHLNNFIQLHKNGSSLALTFNTNNIITVAQVPIEEEISLRIIASNHAGPLSKTPENSSNSLNQVNSTQNRTNIPGDQYFIDNSIRASNTSGSGQPIQIKIERHRLRTTFYVNDNFMVIERPMIFLTNYSQNPWINPDVELVRPPRPKVGSKTYSQIFLANIDEYFMTRLPGFTGCIQGLSIDNQLFDFNRAHLTGEIKGDYRMGCKMHCDSVPCRNQGTCIENWKEDKIECKCDSTSYIGRLCDEDIAALFNGHSSYFLYHLTKNRPTKKTDVQMISTKTSNSNSTRHNISGSDIMLNDPHLLSNDLTDHINFFEVSLAFSTDVGQIDSQIVPTMQVLVFIKLSNSSKHFFLGLTPDGSLLVQEDYGNLMSLSRLIKRPDHPFNDGYRHMFKYSRYNQTIHIVADYQTYLPSLSVITGDHVNLWSKRSIILVGTASKRPGDNSKVNYTNYSGCISNLVVKLDEITTEPLSEAFGQNIETISTKTTNQSFKNSKDPLKNTVSDDFRFSRELNYSDSLPDSTMRELSEQSKTLSIINKKDGKEVGDDIEAIIVRDVEQGKCTSFKKSEITNEKRSINEPKYTPILEPRLVYMDPPRLKAYKKPPQNFRNQKTLYTFGPLFFCSLTILISVSLSASIYAYILEARYKSEKFRCETPFFHRRDEIGDELAAEISND